MDRPEFVLAQCYRLVGDDAQAEESFRQSLKKWPDVPEVRRVAVAFLRDRGRTAEAEEALRDALAADPGAAWAARELALILSERLGDPEGLAEAQRLAGPDGPLGDDPGDRLVRALVRARDLDADPARRAAAIAELEALAADLPASDPLAAAARGLLVDLLLAAGRPGDACAQAAALVDGAARPDPADLARYADALRRAGRLDEAARQVERLAELAPGDLRVDRLRAGLRLDRGDRPGAVAALEAAAAARDPAGPGGDDLVELARLLAGLGAPEAAVRVGRRLADYDRARSGPLAEALVAAGDLDGALAAAGAALDAGAPIDALVPALERLVTAAAPDRIDDAEALVQRTAAAHPDSHHPLRLLALIRHFQGRFEEAVALYGRMDALDPDDDLYLNNWAWTLSEELDQPAEALDIIDRAARRAGPEELGAILDTKGAILMRQGQPEAAIAALESSLRARPSGVTEFHLARAYRAAGRDDDARAAQERARELGVDPAQLSKAERADWDALSRP